MATIQSLYDDLLDAEQRHREAAARQATTEDSRRNARARLIGTIQRTENAVLVYCSHGHDAKKHPVMLTVTTNGSLVETELVKGDENASTPPGPADPPRPATRRDVG